MAIARQAWLNSAWPLAETSVNRGRRVRERGARWTGSGAYITPKTGSAIGRRRLTTAKDHGRRSEAPWASNS